MGVLDNQRIRRNGNRKVRRRVEVRPVDRPDVGRWRPFRWLKRDPRDLLVEGLPAGSGTRERRADAGPVFLARAIPLAGGWLAETGAGALWLMIAGARLTAAVAVAVAAGIVWGTRAALRLAHIARPHVLRGARHSAVIGKKVAVGTRDRLHDQADYMQDGFPDVRSGVTAVRQGVDGARKQVAKNVARVDWSDHLGWPGLRRAGRAAIAGLALGTTVAVVLAAAMLGPGALERSKALAVSDIVISPTERVPEALILETTGVEAGDDLAKVDLEQVADQVRSLPWIESVSLRRRYPGHLGIDVVERQPVLLLADDKLWFVDRHGEVFKPVEPGEWMDLPVVSGLTMDDRVADPDGCRERLGKVMELTHAIDDAQGLDTDNVGEIQLLPSGEFLVRTMAEGVALELDPDGIDVGLGRLDTLLASNHLDLNQVTEIDLSLRNQVVAVKRAER